ncbi:MAG: insulinase family protein [Thermomicrobiales bacterium]|nr:insulinase family protein [Thermomicrobiales bacterium]
MPATPPRKTYTLDNGLTLFLQEKHDAPVTSFWTWYRVGSRNEIPGITGISHWVEHMQFKGTPSLGKGAIFGEVSRIGGQLNAMTSTDWTAYYETIPASEIDLSLRIESDRMVNSLYDPEEVASERTVILSERQGAENRPTYHLYEELLGTAFQSGPYGHSVIGYESDLRSMTRDDLYNHYQRYYRPDNAFITAVGDFDADELAARIERSFGHIANPETPIPAVVAGPPQFAERRVTIKRPSPAAYMMMGYKMPGAKHADIPAIMMADAILSGAKAMGMGGGAGNGRSSRLYRALVVAGLVRNISSSADPEIDENVWSFSATALPGVEPARIEAAIETELDRLKNELVPEDELAKARKQMRANYVYSLETVTGQAYWLGNMEIVDHAGRVDTFADEFAAVTAEDVQRVARTYLLPEKRTIGWQLPADSSVVFDMAGVEAEPAMDVANFADSESEANHQGFVRTVLPNGIVILAQPRPDDGAIDGTIRIKAGHVATGEKTPGLPSVMATMLTRGTENRTFEQFNEEIDSLAAHFGVNASRGNIDIGWHALSEDLDQVLDIAADVIHNPTFPEDELEKLKPQVLTGIEEQEQDTRTMAGRAMAELLYPEDHPYRVLSGGTRESVSAMTRTDLADYYNRWLAPGVTTVALTGGIRDLDDAVQRLERVLGSWQKDVPAPLSAPAVDPIATTARNTKGIEGKSQADINIAYPTLPRLHPDYNALQVANLILGQLGLMGRLGSEVRDKQGMAYYAYSALRGDRANSVWTAAAGVDPANVDAAITGIETELRRIRTELVTDEELADAKSYMIGSLPLGLESLSGVTDLLLTIEKFKLGLDYIDRYPAIISAITKEDVLRAAATHLDADRLAIGIAGPM